MATRELTPATDGAAEIEGITGSRRADFRAWARNRRALAGGGVIVALALFCFVGPLVYHTNQVKVNLNNSSLPPGPGGPLGTNDDGFDILGRLMIGGQSSLELGFAVSIASTLVGTLYGVIAGWAGGIVDMIMMRVIDTFLSLPTLVLLLLLVTIFTPNLLMIIALLTVLSWLGTARLVRGEILSLRTREYVQAAKTLGSGHWRIMLRHLVPNAFGVIVVSATFTIADSILMLSALSFLGLGLPPPAADWGSMLTDGLNYLFDGYWWMVYPPAVILVITLIAFNLIGEAARENLDTRLR
ncbi:MAG TPA: ABC transporter permease [Trebonia sp.]|jgi:peptide/nickel transport system permease protein